MTTGDWLGLICLAGLVGFFAGGFFVWNLFFKREEVDDEEFAEEETEETGPRPRDMDSQGSDESGNQGA
jgi:hypothetical protein